MDAALERLLARGAAAVDAELTPAVIGSLARYLDLLLEWNRKISLTAIRDPADIVTKHFVDSLAVVPHVPLAATRLVDVGSGPGLPGAVIALARPDVEVTLVESNHKKCAFLNTLRRELPLPRVVVESQRIEDLKAAKDFRPYDVAVSRATLELPVWLELGRTLVASGGLVIAMEGAESHDLPRGAERHTYPLADARRAVILARVD